MGSHRFYLPPEQCRGDTMVLQGGEAHHALNVLRVQPGDRVVVLDGAGLECQCDVRQRFRDEVSLTVVDKRSHVPLPYRITLLQALPKGKLIESIIEKATELGAFRIVPLLSERVVMRLAEREAAQKAEKWRLTAVEAIKQCGSPWLPQVETPLLPAQFLARNEPFALPLVASLQTDSRQPREYFRAFEAQHGCKPDSVCVWIGPEGDFTATELTAIQASGALPITLGRRVLRTETAAIYCLSILHYELSSYL